MALLIIRASFGYHEAMKEGTRVPVQTLLDYLKAGESIDDFLEGFPTVTKDQVIAFLDEAKEQVMKIVS